MSKTITLRLDEKAYERFKKMAQHDNRPISNFIETAATRFVEERELVGEFEMTEISNNSSLNRSIKNGLDDVKCKRGRFA